MSTFPRVLVTQRSNNAKVGPIMVTTSESSTCPKSCPFKRNGCYADNGPLGMLWKRLDVTKSGDSFRNGRARVHVRRWGDMVKAVLALPAGSLWRHNQAGDLPHNKGKLLLTPLRQLVAANRGKRGWTYTHHSMRNKHNLRAVTEAIRNGFTINASANSPTEADSLVDIGLPVVTVLPAHQRTNTVTPRGRKIVVCPATTHDGVNCASCKLCTLATRDFIVGFPAHGVAQKKAERFAIAA